METSLHLYGDQGAEFSLRKIVRRTYMLHKPMEQIGEAMLKNERMLFYSKGASGGHPWAPLKSGKPATLRLSDRLFLSLTRHGGENIFNTTRSSVFVGSRVPYMRFHMSGWDDNPARPPIQVSEHDESEYARILKDWIFGG